MNDEEILNQAYFVEIEMGNLLMVISLQEESKQFLFGRNKEKAEVFIACLKNDVQNGLQEIQSILSQQETLDIDGAKIKTV